MRQKQWCRLLLAIAACGRLSSGGAGLQHAGRYLYQPGESFEQFWQYRDHDGGTAGEPDWKRGTGAGRYQRIDGAGVNASQNPAGTFTVYVHTVGVAGGLDLATLTSPWTESTVTYNTAPTKRTIRSNMPTASGSSNWIYDVRYHEALKGWVTTPASNYGLQITASAAQPDTEVILDTKESTTTSHPATDRRGLGRDGAVGPAGPVGATGPTGLPGAAGPTGAAGVTGTVWSNGCGRSERCNRRCGSERCSRCNWHGRSNGEWQVRGVQQALRVPTGAAGVTGTAGSPAGATGPQGGQGSQGIQGPTGLSGGGNGIYPRLLFQNPVTNITVFLVPLTSYNSTPLSQGDERVVCRVSDGHAGCLHLRSNPRRRRCRP